MAKTGSNFTAEIVHISGQVIIVLRGEINSFAEQALNAAYAEAETYQTNSILLDFNHVSYINSTGIALIVGLMSRARKAERQLVAFGLSDHYLEIFHITRLSDFIRIVPDRGSAFEEAARQAR